MYDFTRLLNKYSKSVTIYDYREGGWDQATGLYIEPTVNTINTNVPVVPLSQDDMRNDDGGTLTGEDRKMYYQGNILPGIEVLTDGQLFKVHSRKDYSHYANGLFIYVLVRKGESK